MNERRRRQSRRAAPGSRAGERAAASGSERSPRKPGFGPANYLAFLLAAAAIVGGYALLGQGSVTAAPFLLVLGYAVLLPVGLIIPGRRRFGRVGGPGRAAGRRPDREGE